MVDYPDLSAYYAVLAEFCRARYACLGYYYGSFAYFDIVRYMHEIVYLYVISYKRGAKRRPVNAAVCPNFHIVAYDNPAYLRHFKQPAFIFHKTKTVRSYYRA